MKKLFLGLTAAVIVITGIFTFAGCEKQDESKTTSQNIIKCWGEDDQEGDIYYSTSNPNVLVRLRDGQYITVEGPLLDERPLGRAIWNNDHTSFVCRGTEAVDCGRVKILDDAGQPIREGTYAHVYGPDGTLISTSYNFQDRYQEEE